ncbi:MAG: hypothetical protein UR86_C0017G0001, partial [Parcubacteria group bacterium GW2011_GWD2_35_7]
GRNRACILANIFCKNKNQKEKKRNNKTEPYYFFVIFIHKNKKTLSSRILSLQKEEGLSCSGKVPVLKQNLVWNKRNNW